MLTKLKILDTRPLKRIKCEKSRDMNREKEKCTFKVKYFLIIKLTYAHYKNTVNTKR